MKISITLATLLATSSVYTAEVVTLTDGREVKLNDDFTWHYVVKSPALNTTKVEKAAINTPINTAPTIATIPVVTKNVGTTVVVNSKKPTLQLSDSGVDILLGAASYENGRLILPTSLTNQSTQSVIQVEVEIEVFDMSGNSLVKENVTIWQSIKRMAETYLRPKHAEQGKAIQLTVPESQQYQLTAKVIEVVTR
ncbi:DUF3157 family protein [Vibrio mytili]|uniref:Ribonuclease n=1 Tax=Vibrio mytili TaxID=50718 RepID=A0A0C3I2E0_9VIBR|nr:DUF3157 family protein [Vibrio mytili]KIN09240.1 ribonuclease [Vibrio mytili]